MLKTITAGTVAALIAGATLAGAQSKTLPGGELKTLTATVEAIEQSTRSVTVRKSDGTDVTFYVPKSMTRFDQLKVGDKIKVTYYESLVFEVRKAGQPSTPTADALAAGRARNVPGGGVVTQQTRTVTVKAIDPAVPSITVTTPDGLTFTRKIEDRKNIEGVKPGDRIDITYSQALLIAAQPAK